MGYPEAYPEMPKAGRFDYPLRSLDDCVDFLRRGHEIIQRHVTDRATLAEALHMSAKGGGFAGLIGSAALYGLIETGEGVIRYTDLLKKILHGEPSEAKESMTRAVKNVRLSSEIFERFGSSPSMEQIRIFLREKAFVDISEANSLAEDVSKLLKKDSKYVIPMSTSQNELVRSDEPKPDLRQHKEYKLAEGITVHVPSHLEDDVLNEAWNRSKIAMDVLLNVSHSSPNKLKNNKTQAELGQGSISEGNDVNPSEGLTSNP